MSAILIIYFIISLIIAGYVWSVRQMGILSSLLCGLMWPLTIIGTLIGVLVYALFRKNDDS